MSGEHMRQGQQMGFLERASQGASHHADALVLSCIDFRFPHKIVEYMDSLTPPGKPKLTYDHMALAGASLGAFTGVFPAWAATFWDHLSVSIKLHQIDKVYILDHQDCGGYREYGALAGTDMVPVGSEHERLIHQHYMNRLAFLIQKTHPELEVITHLLELPGRELSRGNFKAASRTKAKPRK